VARKNSGRRVQFPGLFSQGGQVKAIKRLFKAHHVQSQVEPGKNLTARRGKIWMRKEVRSDIEKMVQSTLYAGMPRNTERFVYVGDVRAFVEEIAQTSYGNKSRESLAKARTVALRLTNIMMQRAKKMYAATNRIKVPRAKKSVKVGKKRSYILNTKDAFGHILMDANLIDIFESELERLEL
jgi:hypothetical protein